MALQKYTKEWLQELCANSYSYAEVLAKAGRKPGGGNQSHLKTVITKFQIDVSHFTGQGWNKGKHPHKGKKYTKEEAFTENSSIGRQVIRRYILEDNLIPYKCAWCGNTGTWLGQTMALELDHINGINNDHRLENLRWLCPNCHAITDTYAGRNNRADVPEQAYGSDLESEV